MLDNANEITRKFSNIKAEIFLIILASFIYALLMVPQSYFSMNFLLTRIGDAAQYTDGSLGFLNDKWRWPIMHSNLLGLGGLSMSVFDAIPLAGLVTKTINTIFHLRIQNYIGPWIFLVFFMQPLTAWIACNTWGIKKHLVKIIVIVSCMILPAFTFRVLHTALQSHFLLILSFALFPLILQDKKRTKSLALSSMLIFVTSLVHTYLTVMVFIILAIAYFELGLRSFYRNKRLNDFIFSFQSVLIFTLLILTSFVNQELFTYPSGGGGWSVYSMNVLSPFVVQSDKYVAGQYEGLNFIGPIGFIFCILIVNSLRKLKNVDLLEKNYYSRFTCYSLLIITILSWGSLVFLGSYKLLDYRVLELLPGISDFVTSFRAPGRLFWIPTYFIFLAGARIFDQYLSSLQLSSNSKKNISKKIELKRRQAYSLSLLFIIVQVYLFSSQLTGTYKYMRNENFYQEESKQLIPYLEGNSSVIIFPEFGCLPPSGRDIVPNFHIASSLLSIPINTTKAAREKVPYSCTNSDLNWRLEKYLESADQTTLLVLAAEWSRKADLYLEEPTCLNYNQMNYCLGLPKNNNQP